ncbi:hypothetical protein D3C83_226710 [compost metagenome]
MASRKRNIGQEILDGIREIKRGEHGQVTTVPSVSRVREIDDRLENDARFLERIQRARSSLRAGGGVKLGSH